MRMPRKLRGLVSYFQKGGTGEVLLRLSAYGYLPKALFSLSACHVLVLDALNERALARPLRGYQLGRADRDALDELMACQGERPETPRDFLAGLFDAGHDCFVARHGGRVVAYFWAFKGSYRLRFDGNPRHTLVFALPAGDIFLGNGFIAGAHRLRGLFPHLLHYVVAHYPGGRCFSSVNYTNLGSLQAHRRAGFAPLLIAACVGLGTFSFFCRATDRLRPRGFLGFGRTTLDIMGCLHAMTGETPKTAAQPFLVDDKQGRRI